MKKLFKREIKKYASLPHASAFESYMYNLLLYPQKYQIFPLTFFYELMKAILLPYTATLNWIFLSNLNVVDDVKRMLRS